MQTKISFYDYYANPQFRCWNCGTLLSLDEQQADGDFCEDCVKELQK